MRGWLCLLFVLCALPASAQPVPCDETDGKGIVACVQAAYPDRLLPGVTLAERKAHMIFLRDRIIETARCKMLDVGLNLKRGGPVISEDFVAWKVDGTVRGVDIGASYDDVSKRLYLQWYEYGPPNYGFPTYKAYGPVSCVIAPPPEPEPPPSDTLRAELDALRDTYASFARQTSGQITALVQANEDLRTQMGNLRAQVGNVESALPLLDSRVLTLEQHPVPSGYACSGRGPFGMPIRCSVTAEPKPSDDEVER